MTDNFSIEYFKKIFEIDKKFEIFAIRPKKIEKYYKVRFTFFQDKNFLNFLYRKFNYIKIKPNGNSCRWLDNENFFYLKVYKFDLIKLYQISNDFESFYDEKIENEDGKYF